MHLHPIDHSPHLAKAIQTWRHRLAARPCLAQRRATAVATLDLLNRTDALQRDVDNDTLDDMITAAQAQAAYAGHWPALPAVRNMLLRERASRAHDARIVTRVSRRGVLLRHGLMTFDACNRDGCGETIALHLRPGVTRRVCVDLIHAIDALAYVDYGNVTALSAVARVPTDGRLRLSCGGVWLSIGASSTRGHGMSWRVQAFLAKRRLTIVAARWGKAR